MADRQTFRSPFAVVIWWVWVLFALGNLIDLAVQGRDHLSVVAAFILVLVTGVMYTTAQRPRIIADEDGLTVTNPLRDHRIGWAAVTGFDSTDLLRVRCEWPLDGALPLSESLDVADSGPPGMVRRAIYSWAIHTSRRRQVTAQLRVERPRLRARSLPGTAGSYGVPPDRAASDPPAAGDSEQVIAELTALADRAHTVSPRPRALPPVSTWYLPAFAAIVIPALALVIAIFA